MSLIECDNEGTICTICNKKGCHDHINYIPNNSSSTEDTQSYSTSSSSSSESSSRHSRSSYSSISDEENVFGIRGSLSSSEETSSDTSEETGYEYVKNYQSIMRYKGLNMVCLMCGTLNATFFEDKTFRIFCKESCCNDFNNEIKQIRNGGIIVDSTTTNFDAINIQIGKKKPKTEEEIRAAAEKKIQKKKDKALRKSTPKLKQTKKKKVKQYIKKKYKKARKIAKASEIEVTHKGRGITKKSGQGVVVEGKDASYKIIQKTKKPRPPSTTTPPPKKTTEEPQAPTGGGAAAAAAAEEEVVVGESSD